MRGIFPFFATILFLSSFAVSAEDKDPTVAQRMRMVEDQIRRRGVMDERVLRAMGRVPRHLFIPLRDRDFAYGDYPVAIGLGQTISQPYIVAYMTEVLGLESQDKVLEIGTGSGYQAAVLAEIVREVYTVELLPELASRADKLLQELGYRNIQVRQGDGYKGWIDHAPYDAIIVTAAPPEVPSALLQQLKIGGRMVIPVGDFFQELQLITRTPQGFDYRQLIPVRFVPLVPGSNP
jgi:protein-L-isoaspartate(D-aspartate) O-methyltransferase